MTALVSSLSIGAIATTPYDFAVQIGAVVNPKGFQTVTFTGTLQLVLCKQLKELVANPTGRTTIGGVTGIRETIAASAVAIDDINGDHLLLTWSHSPDGIRSSWPYAAFTLTTIYIGDLAP